MRREMRVLLAIGFIAPAVLGAQGSDTARVVSDSVIERAKQLSISGNEGEGRRLIDSLVRNTPVDDPRYAEALYWRGTLAGTAADAERDYGRLLLEAPFSPRAEDALLRLAQLEQARGDRRGASDHLQRFLLTYGNSPERPRAALTLVQLLFELGPQQAARGCEALRVARNEIPSDNVEMRNRLEYYAPRCDVAMTSPPPPPPPVPPTVDSAATPDTSTAPIPPRPAPASSRASAFYSVQVAAYETREAAARMVETLGSRGIEARVDGTERPFRVRVGEYSTRAAAVKAANELKAQGHDGFVTLVNRR